MGREVRMVPANWSHPKDDKGNFMPLLGGGYSKRLTEWFEGKKKWDEGFVTDFSKYPDIGWKSRVDIHCESFEEWDGKRPQECYYMPEYPDGECTHYQMYETCTEGTPLSPPMSSPELLARYLASSGASAFGRMTATYEEWLSTIKAGSVPSGMIISGGSLQSGVSAFHNLDSQ